MQNHPLLCAAESASCAIVAARDVNGTSTAWSRLGTNLPNTSINNLRLDPDGLTLLAATHGRGLWSVQIP